MVYAAMFLAIALLLPFLTGQVPQIGGMLLPMHLPVLLAGMLWGRWAGFTCGLVSPIVSFALTGMPGAALLPFMMVELAAYGLTAGLLRRKQCPAFVKVLLVQVAGRLARAAALAVAVYGFSFDRLPISLIWTSIYVGLAGILIQWAILPWMWRRVRP